VKTVVTPHAVDRFRERHRPDLDHAAAENLLRSIAQQAKRAKTTTLNGQVRLVSDDIVIVAKYDRGDEVLVTVLPKPSAPVTDADFAELAREHEEELARMRKAIADEEARNPVLGFVVLGVRDIQHLIALDKQARLAREEEDRRARRALSPPRGPSVRQERMSKKERAHELAKLQIEQAGIREREKTERHRVNQESFARQLKEENTALREENAMLRGELEKLKPGAE